MDISVALGGGGVKGFAHIGILRALENNGFRIRAIAGTSAGGMIGAIYAAGHSPDAIEKSLGMVDQRKLYLRTPNDGPAMLGLSNVLELLREILGGCTFADLRIPFAVTAVDMDSAQPVIIRHGNVLDAIEATIAVPGVFPPKKINGYTLIDGGVLNPVPVALARALAPDLPVVAVVLSPPLEAWVARSSPRLLTSLPFMATYVQRLRVAQAFNIFMRSVDIAGCYLTDLILRQEKPEVVIRPKVESIGLIDEVDIFEVAAEGDKAVLLALPEIRKAVSLPSKLWRKLPWKK